MADLNILDYLIFSMTLFASLCIGVYHAYQSRKKDTTDRYLIANQKMKPIPVSISLVISTFSAIAVLGDAEEIYFYGVEYWFITISYVMAGIIVAQIFVPLLYPLKIKSSNEVGRLTSQIIAL